MESWITIMYHVQDAHTEWAWIYFVLVIVIGSFFLLNMVLVVISVQFSETKSREEKLMAKEKREERMANSNSSSSITSAESQNEKGALEELLFYLVRLIKNPIENIFRIKIGHPKRKQGDPDSSRYTTTLQILICCFRPLSNTKIFKLSFDLRDFVKKVVDSSYFQNFIFGTILVNSIFMGVEYHNQVYQFIKYLISISFM